MTNPIPHSPAETSGDAPSTATTATTAATAGSAAAGNPGGSAQSSKPDDVSAGRPPQAGWLESLQSTWRELPGLVSDRVDLLSLELQRAGRVLAQIVALLVAAAILGVTAWLALWAGVAVGLVELGLHWSLSLLFVLALNAGVAWLAIVLLRLRLPLLGLPATRRHLTPGRRTEAPVSATAGAVPETSAASAPLGQAG